MFLNFAGRYIFYCYTGRLIMLVELAALLGSSNSILLVTVGR